MMIPKGILFPVQLVAVAITFIVIQDVLRAPNFDTYKGHADKAEKSSMNSVNNTAVPGRRSFCEPREREGSSTPTQRAPLVIWAHARTGSTLLLDILKGINSLTTEQELDLVTYGELYNGEIKARDLQLGLLEEDIKKSCKTKAGPGETSWWQKQAEYLYSIRHVNPTRLFYSLSDIPSWSKRPFYIVKMFNDYLKTMTEEHLVQNLNKLEGVRKPKYVVLWRRRMIEREVSVAAARATGEWQHRKGHQGSKPTRVTLNKKSLVESIQKMHQYYSSVHDALRSSNADYMILEYDQDLLDASAQQRTIQRLIDFLGVGSSNIDVQQIISKQGIEKQAVIPIHEQVKNWQEVVEWGFGGEVDDWQDIFAE